MLSSLYCSQNGATTLSTATLRITTHSIAKLVIVSLGITTLSIMALREGLTEEKGSVKLTT